MTSVDESEPQIELKPLLEYASVRVWIDGLQQHWGGDPANDDSERLPMLVWATPVAGRYLNEWDRG